MHSWTSAHLKPQTAQDVITPYSSHWCLTDPYLLYCGKPRKWCPVFPFFPPHSQMRCLFWPSAFHQVVACALSFTALRFQSRRFSTSEADSASRLRRTARHRSEEAFIVSHMVSLIVCKGCCTRWLRESGFDEVYGYTRRGRTTGGDVME